MTDAIQFEQLGWPTLQNRQKISRVQLLYKILQESIALYIASYYLPKQRITRHVHFLPITLLLYIQLQLPTNTVTSLEPSETGIISHNQSLTRTFYRHH